MIKRRGNIYMDIQLIRHATHVITLNGKRILVDPMFSEKGILAPVPNAPNQHLNNPLTELPFPIQNFMDVNAILVTHTHRDHFDNEAIKRLPKTLPIFCQPKDESLMKQNGFEQIIAIEKEYTWEEIQFTRTPGKHGHGELAEKMGPVSGFVLETEGEPTLYIIGDSVWYSEIESKFKRFTPDVALIFAGEARFLEGDPITMGLTDIQNIIDDFPATQLVVSHMESWNHCLLTRDEVRQFIEIHDLREKIVVPENGEIIRF
jgi:L-ascorbate metabolism protein UlaG (beta-lactamase superfamily)